MKDYPHIGNIIKAEMQLQGRTNKWLAARLNCQPSNICKLYKKEFIDTYQLLHISEALGTDFFKLYSDWLNS